MAEEYEIIQLKAIQVVNDRGSKGHHKELQVYTELQSSSREKGQVYQTSSLKARSSAQDQHSGTSKEYDNKPQVY